MLAFLGSTGVQADNPLEVFHDTFCYMAAVYSIIPLSVILSVLQSLNTQKFQSPEMFYSKRDAIAGDHNWIFAFELEKSDMEQENSSPPIKTFSLFPGSFQISGYLCY